MKTMRLEVQCINKDDRLNPHERIKAIGGIDENGEYQHLELEDAIKLVDLGFLKPFVRKVGKEIEVVVAEKNGTKYLKTIPDNDLTNNLLFLKECK